jgi:hypothetical protein
MAPEKMRAGALETADPRNGDLLASPIASEHTEPARTSQARWLADRFGLPLVRASAMAPLAFGEVSP